MQLRRGSIQRIGRDSEAGSQIRGGIGLLDDDQPIGRLIPRDEAAVTSVGSGADAERRKRQAARVAEGGIAVHLNKTVGSRDSRSHARNHRRCMKLATTRTPIGPTAHSPCSDPLRTRSDGAASDVVGDVPQPVNIRVPSSESQKLLHTERFEKLGWENCQPCDA